MDKAAEIEMELLELFVLLDKFLEQPGTRSAHLRTSHATVYVRRSIRAFTDSADWRQGGNCLDIADVTIAEDFRGHRIFSRFMDYAMMFSPYPYIVLECVHNPILADYATRHGWNNFNVNCYWRRK